MSVEEQSILPHHVQTYILHSLTSLFITVCYMYVFLHPSGEEHTGCHSRQEEAVSLWGDRDWSGPHCGSLYHHEPGICWQDRTAREPQSSFQVRQESVRLLYVSPSPVLYLISFSFTSSLLFSPFFFLLFTTLISLSFSPPLHHFSPLSHSCFHPSTSLLHSFSTLSRPCAMVVPDFELIAEIMLVAEGFLEARLLARKFLTLYTLCKVQCMYNPSLPCRYNSVTCR